MTFHLVCEPNTCTEIAGTGSGQQLLHEPLPPHFPLTFSDPAPVYLLQCTRMHSALLSFSCMSAANTGKGRSRVFLGWVLKLCEDVTAVFVCACFCRAVESVSTTGYIFPLSTRLILHLLFSVSVFLSSTRLTRGRWGCSVNNTFSVFLPSPVLFAASVFSPWWPVIWCCWCAAWRSSARRLWRRRPTPCAVGQVPHPPTHLFTDSLPVTHCHVM